MVFFLLSLALSYSEPVETVILKNGDGGSKYYRIPAIVRANDGSLITATDKRWYNLGDLPAKIDVVIKRSTDGGKTWGEALTIAGLNTDQGYGDASLVVDKKTGTVFCFFNGEAGFFSSTAEKPQRHFYCKSTDNGVTWTEKVDFTHFIYSPLCTKCPEERKTWKGMFLTSGAAHQLRDGRIMIAGVVQKTSGGPLFNYAIWSDDLCETWTVAEQTAYQGGDEAKVVEINNGDVIMSIRHGGHRMFAYSHDRGNTWDKAIEMKEIRDPACDGDFIRYTSIIDGYDKNRLIHTIPYSNSRQNVSILLSYDEGKTWPVSKVIHAQGSAYSAAAFTDDGTIHVYYERGTNDGFDMVDSQFSLDWLTDGDDHFNPPVVVNARPQVIRRRAQ